MKKSIADGVVHKVPVDLCKVLTSSEAVQEIWADITPLARNEWICWIESAKKTETRSKRIEWARLIFLMVKDDHVVGLGAHIDNIYMSHYSFL